MSGVTVQGPDGKTYQFPDGTDKTAAIAYFKKKGVGAPTSKTGSTLMERRIPGFFETHPRTREAILGAFGGAGIPETMHPVSDLAKGVGQMLSPKASSEDVAPYSTSPVAPQVTRLAVGAAKQLGQYGKEIYNPSAPGERAHGIAGLTTMIGSLVGGPKAAAEVKPLPEIVGIRTRAGKAFSAAETAFGGSPVDHAPIVQQMAKVNDLAKKGFTPPKIMKDLANWIDTQSRPHLENAPGGGKIDTAGSKFPLTFKDGRDFYTGFNEAINWESVEGGRTGKMGKAVLGVRQALGDELAKTATRNGFGPQYAQALSDYTRAAQFEQKMAKTGALVGGGVGGAAGHELGKMAGHPWVGSSVGASLGYKVGPKIARKAARAITSVGKERVAPEIVPQTLPAENVHVYEPPQQATPPSPVETSPAVQPRAASQPSITQIPPAESISKAYEATAKAKVPSDPNTVQVTVGGETRSVKLSNDKLQQWNEAKRQHEGRVDWARRTFANDPKEMQARIKGAGMQYAAEKRAITGELTGKEKAAHAARESSNYRGKAVTVGGRKGTVTGMSFGKVRVRLGDGTIISANPEDVL